MVRYKPNNQKTIIVTPVEMSATIKRFPLMEINSSNLRYNANQKEIIHNVISINITIIFLVYRGKLKLRFKNFFKFLTIDIIRCFEFRVKIKTKLIINY